MESRSKLELFRRRRLFRRQNANFGDDMTKFEETYCEILEMVAGDGGVFGSFDGGEHGGAVGNSDWYASGDARIPTYIGAKKKRVKKTRRSKMDAEVEMPIQRIS